MNKHIYVPSEVKREMAKTFRVSLPTLWNALNFVHNSAKSKMLRAAAMQRHGVVYDPHPDRPQPGHITTFETGDDTMTQRFGDRVWLIGDMRTGTVTIYIDGEPAEQYEHVAMTE